MIVRVELRCPHCEAPNVVFGAIEDEDSIATVEGHCHFDKSLKLGSGAGGCDKTYAVSFGIQPRIDRIFS